MALSRTLARIPQTLATPSVAGPSCRRRLQTAASTASTSGAPAGSSAEGRSGSKRPFDKVIFSGIQPSGTIHVCPPSVSSRLSCRPTPAESHERPPSRPARAPAPAARSSATSSARSTTGEPSRPSSPPTRRSSTRLLACTPSRSLKTRRCSSARGERWSRRYWRWAWGRAGERCSSARTW